MKNQLPSIPYLQMSETQIANELLHGNLCGSQHFLFEHCEIFFLPTLFSAFLRTYMLVHCCKSNAIFELSFQFVCMNSRGSLMVLPSSPWVLHSGVQLSRLNCLLWLSIRLFLLSQALPFIIHSSPFTYHLSKRTIWHWLRPILSYNLPLTLRWLIQQCLSAQHMWLTVTPFVNPL